MHRSARSPLSCFGKPHEILSSRSPAGMPNPFSHSRARNRSSGESSVPLIPAQANLLLDPTDDKDGVSPRSRASRSKSRSRSVSPPWDGLSPNSIPLLPMHEGSTGHGASTRNLLSRSPSPYLRRSDDLDGLRDGVAGVNDWKIGAGSGNGDNRGLGSWGKNGKLGWWLWSTQRGWMVYTGLAVVLYGACGFGLLVMNRLVLWTGVYKFGYPIMTTLLQLIITQILLYLFASVTRSFSRSLYALGLGCMVAPESAPSSKGKRRESSGGLRDFAQKFGAGGSGGVFEFRFQEAKPIFPLAVIYSLKIGLSNLSFAYTQLPIYQMSRILSLPLTMIFTYFFLRHQSLSVTTLSSCITMTLSLAMVSLRPGTRFAIEGFLAGLFSSLFVAIYPILLQKTHKSFLTGPSPNDGVLSGDLLGVGGDVGEYYAGDGKDEARAAWKLLHYVNLMAIFMVLPWVFISGEYGDIGRNCYFLDVPFFWLMILCGGIGAWATFITGFVLVRATTPLTMVVTTYPRSALQSIFLMHFKLPTWSWVGVLMCWGSSVWYLIGRRKEIGVSFFSIENGGGPFGLEGQRGRDSER